MNFSEAKNYIEGCVKSWESLKSQFSGREREILGNSYLVVSYPGGQLSLSEFNPAGIAENHQSLLTPTEFNQDLIKMVKKKAWVLSEIEKYQRILQWMKNQIERLNKSMIQLDEFTVEVRFNQLNFELIRKLKQSKFCDKDKTDISNVSIRVVLKGD